MATRTDYDTATRAEAAAERAQDALDARYLRGAVGNAEYARACRRIAHQVERQLCRARPVTLRQMHAEG